MRDYFSPNLLPNSGHNLILKILCCEELQLWPLLFNSDVSAQLAVLKKISTENICGDRSP